MRNGELKKVTWRMLGGGQAEEGLPGLRNFLQLEFRTSVSFQFSVCCATWIGCMKQSLLIHADLFHESSSFLLLVFWTNFHRLVFFVTKKFWRALLFNCHWQTHVFGWKLECIHVHWRLFRMSDRRIVCEAFLATNLMPRSVLFYLMHHAIFKF